MLQPQPLACRPLDSKIIDARPDINTHAVLVAQLSGEGSAHKLSPHIGGGSEVCLQNRNI